MKFELTSTFDCSLETYEEVFLTDEYRVFLEENVPNIEKIELVSREDEGDLVRRRVRYSPKPGAYKVGPKKVPTAWTVFDEISTFDRARHELQFSNHPYIPEMLRGKFTNTGTLRLRPEGPNRVQRTISGEIHVRIFLVGKIAERIIHKAGIELLEQEAEAMKKFLASRSA